jgi:hypothetical protein
MAMSHGLKIGSAAPPCNGGNANSPCHCSNAARRFAELTGYTPKSADHKMHEISLLLPQVVTAYLMADDSAGLSEFFGVADALRWGGEQYGGIPAILLAQAAADANVSRARTAYALENSETNRVKLLHSEKMAMGRAADLITALEAAAA